MKLFYTYFKSPVGTLKLIASDRGLTAVLWENDPPKRVRLAESIPSAEHPVLQQSVQELSEYFAGTRSDFSIPLEPQGTEFQRKVWTALTEIPYGKTWSYGELAKRIGNAKASRAVGAANGKNPISIIVPCHRVIGTGGQLTGFAGGLPAKKFLLSLEVARPAHLKSAPPA